MAASENRTQRALSEDELQDLVASTDSGARSPRNRAVALLIAGLALFWSLFQVWIAEPQFWFGQLPFVKILGSEQTRPMHLALGLALAFLAYPAAKTAPRHRVPLYDWVLAAAGAGCALYVFWFSDTLARTARSGLPTQAQIWVGAVGILVLLEASRRSLGPALTVVASLFLAYSYFGQGWLIPDLIAHEGRSFESIVNTQWLSTEGIFGIPLGVSAAFVFLFVLFGSLLDKAGAGSYFIKMAFAGLGHLRGGPAKAAVVGSAATGLISGSSIANVVTTGTFTIPLMKRVGFSSERAGAVEVASSVNGQIMPPVMGAAAFLMVEFIGIPYPEVIKHAVIPATISYIALVYIVHLEALKKDMPALGESRGLMGMLLKVFVGFVVAGALFYATIWAVGLLRGAAPALVGWALAAVVAALYLGALGIAAGRPDLERDDPNAKQITLPVMREVVPTGLHFLLPILILVWYLMVERQSPAKSAFYAVAAMVIILLTQRPIKSLLRGERDVASAFRQGFDDLIEGMIAGARNMIGIAVATGAAGIIVATVTRTPIGTELAGLVEFLSGGNLFIMLVLVGVFSLILGMGLPTTANYIVVSALMANVLVTVGAQEGLIVPLIAAHLFVFYFGIMADVTPPVGLASFAAAAVSGGDPMRTGIIAFMYSLRTVALPFLFIYNPALILYGIDLGTLAGVLMALKVFVVATIAMLLFAAATQGYFLAPSRWWESAALLLVAFTLFVPNFWLDRVQPRFEVLPGTQFETLLAAAEPGERLRFVVEGPDFVRGDIRRTTLVLDVDQTPPEGRMAATGLFLMPEPDRMVMDEPMPATAYSEVLKGFDFYGDTPVQILQVERPNERLPREIFYLPALLLLGVVVMFQRRRQTKPAF